ncbi:hypothetical protein A6302_03993 [Methylobrevis pamukkalensis]|uniref:Uncharacterized protein n=1 Tax=Methylobrevis pamukkalensis TaxID=1439726 RepID=A0A1E3GXD4_9HYPH|nr:hypothetical protein A6302_03993 [Methylobrevis pamukkalensis]
MTKTRAIEAPSACEMPITSAPTTMKPALRMLTAAITRAREASGAQDWMAANEGTMNRPPATARIVRSIPTAQATGWAKKAARPMSVPVGSSPQSVKPRCSEARPISTEATGTGKRTIRPLHSHEASAEPRPMATANSVR